MYRSILLASALTANIVRAQQVGTLQAEVHPAITWEKCTAPGSCTTQQGQVVIDANWRYVHDASPGAFTNCYTGNTWNTTLCPDDVTCAANCALDGALYQQTYGATTSGNALTLNFVTQTSSGPNIGSRLYLMDTETTYAQFKLLNQEFTFDVDVSQLPCVSEFSLS
jgi:cellulose 1,4-beta-cellobiosidase